MHTGFGLTGRRDVGVGTGADIIMPKHSQWTAQVLRKEENAHVFTITLQIPYLFWS